MWVKFLPTQISKTTTSVRAMQQAQPPILLEFTGMIMDMDLIHYEQVNIIYAFLRVRAWEIGSHNKISGKSF